MIVTYQAGREKAIWGLTSLEMANFPGGHWDRKKVMRIFVLLRAFLKTRV